MGYLATIWLAATETEGGHAEEPSGFELILPAIDELIWGAVAFALVLLASPLPAQEVDATSNRHRPRGNAVIEVQQRGWFNPELDYLNFMVPGIRVILDLLQELHAPAAILHVLTRRRAR